MSRVGKSPIPIPSGVEVSIDGPRVSVKGPKGELAHGAPPSITVTREGDELVVSRPVHFEAPEGISFEVPTPTRITVRGCDKQLVGQVAADIRKIRKPEPYKGKGIRYADERVQRKAGKSAKAAGVTGVVFDRGGFRYHGRVAAVAEGAREAGLEL